MIGLASKRLLWRIVFDALIFALITAALFFVGHMARDTVVTAIDSNSDGGCIERTYTICYGEVEP